MLQHVVDFDGVIPLRFPQALESLDLSGTADEEILSRTGGLVKSWALEAAQSPLFVLGNDASGQETLKRQVNATWLRSKQEVLQQAMRLHEAGQSLIPFLMGCCVVDRALAEVFASFTVTFFFWVWQPMSTPFWDFCYMAGGGKCVWETTPGVSPQGYSADFRARRTTWSANGMDDQAVTLFRFLAGPPSQAAYCCLSAVKSIWELTSFILLSPFLSFLFSFLFLVRRLQCFGRSWDPLPA